MDFKDFEENSFFNWQTTLIERCGHRHHDRKSWKDADVRNHRSVKAVVRRICRSLGVEPDIITEVEFEDASRRMSLHWKKENEKWTEYRRRRWTCS